LKRNKQLDKHCGLDSIYFEENFLYINIKFPKRTLIDRSQMTLLFVERYTTKKKEYSLTVINKMDHTIQACLTEMDLQQLLTDGKDWDVYVSYLMNNSSEKIRLRSNYMELELLFFLNDDKMLAPFTTDNGNVSFKSQIPRFITKVEQINFIKKDHIGIKGYVMNPLWSEQPADIQRRLVLSTNIDEHAIKVPLKSVDGDYSELYRNGDYNFRPIGYEAVVPIHALLSGKNEEITLKARIEISYTEGSRKVTTETPPIKLKSSAFTKKSLIKIVNGKKKLVSINKTKKASQLTIKINNYDFYKEIKSQIKQRLLYIKRHSIIKNLYKKAFYVLGLLPVNKKIVIFESFLGKQFSDNPRAIYEYLQENQYPYKLYWSVDKKYLDNFKDKNLNCIKRFSIKWLFIMPRARFWVTNSRFPLWIPKPKHTTYIQTWHGTPLKRLAADMEEVYMPGTTAEKYKKNFIKEAKNWDYLISPNAYSTEIFRRAFQFDKEVLETGYPRNDFICKHNNQDTREKLVNNYGIPLDKKVILYAPTWRDDQFYEKGKYRFDINLDLDLMREKLGDNYVILFRLHYLISENLDLTPYEGFAYDFSNHEDIRELYLLADILITDYSSVFFDYSNLRRPMIFYVYDIDQYRDNLRGFYFDFEQEAPGPLVKTTEELIQTVKMIEADGFQRSKKYELFYERFCYLENGDSTRKVVDNIFRN
jgi:CDP-glycerol glycerophosphotransferase